MKENSNRRITNTKFHTGNLSEKFEAWKWKPELFFRFGPETQAMKSSPKFESFQSSKPSLLWRCIKKLLESSFNLNRRRNTDGNTLIDKNEDEV